MDYKGEWGEGALDTPGPLNGTSEAAIVEAGRVLVEAVRVIVEA
jgi:hypothetical protein